jgi:DUF971 family protein
MTTTPTDICAIREKGLLTITWTDRQAELPFVFLRGRCECAHCVNEWTGERMLDLATIPADITIEKLEQVGGYAIRISWSDGHNSGLYTWERLRKVAEDR